MTDSFDAEFRDSQEKGLVSFLVGAGGGGNCFAAAGGGPGGGDQGTFGSFPAKPMNPDALGDLAGSAGFSSLGTTGERPVSSG